MKKITKKEKVLRVTHSTLDRLSDLIVDHYEILDAHQVTLIWSRMQQMTRRMHNIKYDKQSKEWGTQ